MSPTAADVQFKAAKLKIKRADKHISDLQTIISRLPDEYSARLHQNAQTKFIVYGLTERKDVVHGLALIIGDAIHNMRCALDYAWIGAMIKCNIPVSEKDSFPVYPTSQFLENALKKRQVDVACPALYDLVVTYIKPYSGGDDAIRAIHVLDRTDKHRLLVPMLNITFLHGLEVEDEHGNVTSFSWASTQPGPHRFSVASGTKLKNQGQITVTVVFHQGTPTHDAEVVSILSQFRQATISTVDLLEGV